MSAVDQAQLDHPRRAGRLLWPNLPLLCCGALLVSLSWAVVRLVAPGLSVLSVVLHSLLVVPTFAPLLKGCQVLLTDEHFRIVDLFRTLRRDYLSVVKVGLLPTVTVLLTVSAFDIWYVARQPWMLVSLGLGLSATVVTLYIWVIALPYALRSPSSSLAQGWLVSFYVASRNPVPVLAVVSSVGLAVWATNTVSFALALLIPGPLALIWAAAMAAASDHSRTPLRASTPARTEPSR